MSPLYLQETYLLMYDIAKNILAMAYWLRFERKYWQEL